MKEDEKEIKEIKEMEEMKETEEMKEMKEMTEMREDEGNEEGDGDEGGDQGGDQGGDEGGDQGGMKEEGPQAWNAKIALDRSISGKGMSSVNNVDISKNLAYEKLHQLFGHVSTCQIDLRMNVTFADLLHAPMSCRPALLAEQCPKELSHYYLHVILILVRAV